MWESKRKKRKENICVNVSHGAESKEEERERENQGLVGVLVPPERDKRKVCMIKFSMYVYVETVLF